MLLIIPGVHPPEELRVDRAEIELLFVNNIGDHSMLPYKGGFTLNLAECSFVGIFFLVLEFNYNLFLRFS